MKGKGNVGEGREWEGKGSEGPTFKGRGWGGEGKKELREGKEEHKGRTQRKGGAC